MIDKLLLIFILGVSLHFSTTAQITEGFDAQEARNMIQLCNSFSYLDLYGDDQEIIPANYHKIYTPPAYKMDNMFQVYSNGEKAVINFRGTTANQLSWMENLYASMIPIKGEIMINDNTFS